MERRLAAILATDVVGYSRLVRADEEAALKAVKALHTDCIIPTVKANHGRVFKLMGDGMLAEFASVVDAVRAAVAIQQAIGDGGDIRLRAGINLGDIVVDGDDIHGDGVNVAARLESMAAPGGLLVSAAVHDQVRDRLDLAFEDLGDHPVKNIDRPVHVWRWAPAGEARDSAGKATGHAAKPTIAVLPFDNMSGDPEQEYLADGMTEDIITEMSKFRWLTVIARNSTFVYKKQAVDVPRIGRDLGAGYVLEGSVRKAGERVRITAQLIDAPINEHIWAERYDRQLRDIFDLQDEITHTIVGMIEPELANRERERVRDTPTDDMNAWELYQRALWHRWRFTPDDIAKAHGFFDAAIARDPGFAAAYAHRAWTIYVEIMISLAEDPAAARAAATADARRAIELNDRDPLSFCAYGFVLTVTHQFGEAVQRFRRAIDLNPSFAAAHYGLSVALTFAGTEHAEAALAAARTAARLSPNDPLMWTFLNIEGMVLIRAGDYAAARESFARASQYPNALFWVPSGLAVCAWELGNSDEARRIIAAARHDDPGLTIARVTGFLGTAAALFERYIQVLREIGVPET